MVAIGISGESPLQPSAEATGSAWLLRGAAELLQESDFVEQQADDSGRLVQHVARAASDAGAASAMPFASVALMPTMHAAQDALPGFTRLAAAIHCVSLKRANAGGCTPCSSAQTRRSSGVWQQQAVQHSTAPAQPQPHPWQG